MKEIFANRGDSEVIEVYAVLSHKQYDQVQNGEAEIEIPYNTELINKSGSRTLFITCYGRDAATELADGLDASGVSWQEVYRGEDVISDLSKPQQPDEEVKNRDSGYQS
jgi:hypothetical protein